MRITSDIRGADYRAKAQDSLALAQGSALLQVRRRHEAAAPVWLELAAFEDRRTAHAREVAGRMTASPHEEPQQCQS